MFTRLVMFTDWATPASVDAVAPDVEEPNSPDDMELIVEDVMAWIVDDAEESMAAPQRIGWVWWVA